MHAPPMLQDPPIITDNIVPALKTAGVSRVTVSVPYTIVTVQDLVPHSYPP